MSRIQVLISTYGDEGIKRIASLAHPEYPGIEYIVSWQNYDKAQIPESLKQRKDFKIYFEDSKGLSNNRNAALAHATAPWVLISDDDLNYEIQYFERLIEVVGNHSDQDFLTLKYESSSHNKEYPALIFNLKSPPKKYFVSSIEILINIERIKNSGVSSGLQLFNPAFGLNGKFFPCGEEDVLIHFFHKKGLKGRFIPLTITFHSGLTTSDKIKNTFPLISTKGAVVSYIHSASWPCRMLVHAWRSRKEISFMKYCKWWLSGVSVARKNKVFENY